MTHPTDIAQLVGRVMSTQCSQWGSLVNFVIWLDIDIACLGVPHLTGSLLCDAPAEMDSREEEITLRTGKSGQMTATILSPTSA